MGRGTLICRKTDGLAWTRGLTTNSTQTSYPTVANTTTAPATVQGSYFTFQSGWYNDLAICPFGTGDDGGVFDFKVVGWSRVVNGLGNGATVLWKPVTIFRATATLSTSVGVEGATQTDVERDADTIVAGSPTISSALYTIYSPADDTPAMVVLNSLDFEIVAIYFDRGSNCTGANANWRWIGE